MNYSLSNKIRQIATEKMCDVMDDKLSMEDFEAIIHIYIECISMFSEDSYFSLDALKKEIIKKRKSINIPVDAEELMILNSAFDQTEAYLEDKDVKKVHNIDH